MEIGVRRFHNNFSTTIIFISGKDLQKIKFSANLTHHIFSFFLYFTRSKKNYDQEWFLCKGSSSPLRKYEFGNI